MEEEMKKKKIEEYKKMQEAAKIEEQLKSALRIALEEDAYERMMNVSYANKELYVNAAQRVLMASKRHTDVTLNMSLLLFNKSTSTK